MIQIVAHVWNINFDIIFLLHIELAVPIRIFGIILIANHSEILLVQTEYNIAGLH